MRNQGFLGSLLTFILFVSLNYALVNVVYIQIILI